jgi:hypothetical protein
MTGLAHFPERFQGACDRGQVPKEALSTGDRVDRPAPLRPELLGVLIAGVENPPIGEFDERSAGMPGAESVEESPLEISQDPVLVN